MSGSDSGCELAHLGQYQGKPPALSLFYLFNCRRRIYKYGTRHLGALGSLTPCCWVASFSPGFWYHVFKRWVSWRQGTVYPTSSDCQNIWEEKVLQLLIIAFVVGHLQTLDLLPFAAEAMITPYLCTIFPAQFAHVEPLFPCTVLYIWSTFSEQNLSVQHLFITCAQMLPECYGKSMFTAQI